MPLMRMSYAHICHVANGTQIVEYEGTCMTEDLANAIETQPHRFTVHVEQICATRRHLADSHSGAPFTTRKVPSRLSKKQVEENRLLTIPFEIRQNIWKCLTEEFESMPMECSEMLFRQLNPKWSGPSRSSEVYSRLSSECILASLKRFPITLGYHYDLELDRLRELFNTIDFSDVDTHYKTGFDAVRSLWLSAFQILPDNPSPSVSKSLSFALKCKNITHLTLDVDVNIYDFSTATGPWLAHSPTPFRTGLDLDRVLEWEHLKVLRLRFGALQIASDPGMENFMHELTSDLQEEIRARGRHIRVHCTTLDLWEAFYTD